jgi:hypothetical protein
MGPKSRVAQSLPMLLALYHYCGSGHMMYVHLPTLVQLHDNVADFIRRTIGVR